MLPLRDNIPRRRFPRVTFLLIVCNLVVFLYELTLGTKLQLLFNTVGFVPAHLTAAVHTPIASASVFLSLFSYMFLHGGWLHFIGNMWVLWIFGDNVEDFLGRIAYLGFYLGMGVVAALVQWATAPYSVLPAVGASGAIAAVMGAYFCLYPRARVLTLVPIFFFIEFIELPAFIFLGIWLLAQFFSAAQDRLVSSLSGSGVAWWAHIGGFIFGVIVIKWLGPRRRRS